MRLSTGEKSLITVVVIAAIAIGLWVTEPYWRPAEVVPPLANNDVIMTFTDARSSAAINPTVALKGIDYSVSKTASGGEATWTTVPRGSYTIEAELATYYELETTLLVESATKEVPKHCMLDKLGTFDWGDTKDADTLTPSENQVYTLVVYLNNTADDTVLTDVRVKLEAGETHANITIDDLECTTHAFEEDDLTAETWIISGYTIGDLDAEVDGVGTNATVVVKFRMQLDVGAAASNIVFTASVQDLNGVNPETSGSMTITLTAE